MSSRICQLITFLAMAVLSIAAPSARAQSDLYICNFFGGTITRHNPTTGALVSTFNISRPTGAVVGPDGNLYVISYDQSLRRYNRTTGALIATLATNIATFPDDLKFGPDGNLYIACELFPGILRYDINGNPQPSPGNNGAVFFFGPNRFVSSVFGPDGNLYAVDFGANQVFRFSPTGSLLGSFVSMNLHSPTDLKFGPDGNLYVANRDTNNVSRFNGTTGAFLGVFASGNGLSGSDSFDFGPDGNLYVGGRGNNAVFRFDGTTGAFIDTFISTGLNDPYRVRFFGTSPPGTVSIASITPNQVKVNSAAFQMTIRGKNLGPNPLVRFNNTTMSVVSATSTMIVINVPANLLTTKRIYNVTVMANGKLSNAVPFRITNDNPAAPPNLIIGPVFRTGVDQFSGNRFAVLLLENQGSSDITNINLSNVRLYYDKFNPNSYIQPFNLFLEAGASPPGTLLVTHPGERLQVHFEFPLTNIGPVIAGTISVVGTSDQGNFNAGSLWLLFPPGP